MSTHDIHEYKSFIHDMDVIKDFFETVLLPLENDEVYYLHCQARKKYSDQVIKDPIIKRNFLELKDFNRFIGLIKEFSLVVPLRKDKDVQLDRDMSVIYIDINPKSMFKAYKDFRVKMDKKLESYYLYKDQNVEKYARRLKSHLMSSIAKSIGPRKTYMLFDLDTQVEEKFQRLVDYIKEKNLAQTVVWISKTKNGYHFILKLTKKEKSVLLEPLYRKTVNLDLPELEIKDKEDTRTSVCGTYQGGTPVLKISLDVMK